MTTDYKKLSLFESAIIAMIIVGAFIIGVEFYAGMPKQTQMAIKQSVRVLDMHAVVSADVKIVGFVLDTMHQTYVAVNDAFVQAADISDALGQFSDSSARAYERSLAFVREVQKPSEAYAYAGSPEVLGASVEAQPEDFADSAHFGGYKPDWQVFKNYISSIEIK